MKNFAISNLNSIMSKDIIIKSKSPINAIREFKKTKNIYKITADQGGASYLVREVIYKNDKIFYKAGGKHNFYATYK